MATALEVYQLLFNNTGVIYITDLSDSLDSAASGPVFPYGVPNTPRNRALVANAAALNSKLLGDRVVKIYLDPRPGSETPGPGDASYTSIDIDPAKAVDITDMVLVKGLQEPRDTIKLVVAANAVEFDRVVSETILYIDGGAAYPANVISSFTVNGEQEGDEITIYGITGGNPVVLDPAAFAYLERQVTLSSYADCVTLKLTPDGWSQVVPNRMDSATMRSLGIPVPLQLGVFQLLPASGTMTITPGDTGASAFPGRVYEQDVSVTAAAAIGGALNFSVDTTSALPGDKGSISGNGFGITAFPVNFSDNTGVRATLTTEIAASGKWTVFWVVNKVSGANRVSFSLSPDFSTGNSGFVTTDMIKDAAVTDDKVASGIDGAKLSNDSVPESALAPTVQSKLNSVSRFTVNSLNNVVAVNGGTYYMDATVGNLTATFPAIAANTYQILTFVKTDASVNTITGSGDANVNGAPDFTLASQYDAITIIGNGTEWFIASQMP